MDKTKKIVKDPLVIGIIVGSVLMFVSLFYFGSIGSFRLGFSSGHIESVFKLCLAAFAGSIIGFERENKNRPAGLRTHSLVCIGAAVVMIIPMEMVEAGKVLSTFDVTRLGAQVISGIGFLGAGTIIRDKGNVKGLTTAASLWVVAIIGLSIGAGSYVTSIAATLVAMFILKAFGSFEYRTMMKKKAIELLITTVDGPRQISTINKVIENHQLYLRKMEVIIDDTNELDIEDTIFIRLIVVSAKEIDFEDFYGEIRELNCIIDIERIDNSNRKKIKKRLKVG